MKSIRIAFGYRARVGKDEAALAYKQYLYDKYNEKATVISMASPIYDILHYTQSMVSFDHVKDREFLQWVGQWARKIDPNAWIRAIEPKLETSSSIIVSDLRFKNEAMDLKSKGFKLIKIVNNRVPVIDHESEHDLDDYIEWDGVIENNGTLEEYHANVIRMINSVMPPTQEEEERNYISDI